MSTSQPMAPAGGLQGSRLPIAPDAGARYLRASTCRGAACGGITPGRSGLAGDRKETVVSPGGVKNSVGWEDICMKTRPARETEREERNEEKGKEGERGRREGRREGRRRGAGQQDH